MGRGVARGGGNGVTREGGGVVWESCSLILAMRFEFACMRNMVRIFGIRSHNDGLLVGHVESVYWDPIMPK